MLCGFRLWKLTRHIKRRVLGHLQESRGHLPCPDGAWPLCRNGFLETTARLLPRMPRGSLSMPVYDQRGCSSVKNSWEKTTYTGIRQNNIHKEWRAKRRLQVPRLHISQKKITINPVQKRMRPRKPQRNQMRHEVIVNAHRRPRARRNPKDNDIRQLLALQPRAS